MPLSTLARFIFFPELALIHVERKGPGGAVYHLETTSPYEVCPKCAKVSSIVYDHRFVTVRDAPIRGKGVVLRIRKRRFMCKPCGKPFTEPISGISKGSRTSQRYKQNILWAAQTFANLESVKTAYRCSDGYLYGALYEMLELQRRKRIYPWPSVIGIDEHLFRRYGKGRLQFVTGFVDQKGKRLIELAMSKSPDELRVAVSHIQGRENVRWVTMDLSSPFFMFAKSYFPSAQVVADRFHVQRLFTKMINRKRIDITGDKRKNPIRTLLLRNAEDLEPHERKALWAWLNTQPEMRDLYMYKEAMRRVYRTRGYKKARRGFKRLLDHMATSRSPAVATTRQTLIEWQNEILNYFKTGLTNARAEGFNNKAKLVQRKAFGFKSFAHYRLQVLNACA